MSTDKSLRIAGIFITLVASAVGFAIPYLRGVPKDHDDALSTSWMSLKAYSSGVILSVAVIHLLGEALHVLENVAHEEEALHALENVPHVEDPLHALEEVPSGEAPHEFPLGLCLCLAGIALTLGIELFASFFLSDSDSNSDSGNENPTGKQCCGGVNVEMTSMTLSHDGSQGKNYGATSAEYRQQQHPLCDDPYRLEDGHTHHGEEHVICSNDSKKCSHESQRACSSSCDSHDHHLGTHTESDAQMPTQTQTQEVVLMVSRGLDHSHEHMHNSAYEETKVANKTTAAPAPLDKEMGKEMGCILDGSVDSIHRHVSIVVENPQRSVLKSIILEAAVAVHSVIIGVSLGMAEEGVGALLVALAFHQLFEGVSMGSASLEAGYSNKTALIFLSIFALSVPIGVIIGLNLPSTPRGEEVQAWFACVAAGSLIYTSLVEMVADDFSHFVHSHGSHGSHASKHGAGSGGSKNKNKNTKITAISMYASFLAGLVCMAVLAKWA